MKSLPSIRLQEDTLNRIHQAVKKYNEKNLIKISIQEFRRLSYEILSQWILNDKKLDIEILQKY